MSKSKQKGTLTIPPDTSPEEHELDAVNTLIELGRHITFIAPTRIEGRKSPDIEMNGTEWEIKTPMGNSKTTIFNAMKRGAKQSKLLIIDLRKTKISDQKAIHDIKMSISKTRSIQRVIVINKSSDIIDIP